MEAVCIIVAGRRGESSVDRSDGEIGKGAAPGR